MFEIGCEVSTINDTTIDYRDCTPGGIYHIPAGSTGMVVSRVNDFGMIHGRRVAVMFRDADNYPLLYYKGDPIGPGHYIGEDNLRELELDVPSERELRAFLFS